MSRLASLKFALPAAVLLSGPAMADLSQMTDAERDTFRSEVRAYLLDNPEVLMEAIAVLEQRQTQAQATADQSLVMAMQDQIFNDGYSWVGGNPEGDITIVEFMDYRCGYCRRAFQEVEDLVGQDGNIRFVLKEFPILGEGSTLSSQFAVAVQQLHGADTYKDIHDALIQMQPDATPETLAMLAETFGLDPQPILDRMDSPEVAQVIETNHALANQLQISGTPTFIIGGQMVRGYLPLAQLEQIVSDERAR
jgi:protein-disulfide isomerase